MSALQFWEKNGFQKQGKNFMEAGIEHVNIYYKMWTNISLNIHL